MNDTEEFEDWSHPTTRIYSPPRRRQAIRWTNIALWAVLILLSVGILAFLWYCVHLVREAYRVVFGT